MMVRGVHRRQKLNNLISTPLFTSIPSPSLSHLLSFPHDCLFAIPPLVSPPLKSLCTSSPVALICFSSPISSHFLTLVSYLVHPSPPPVSYPLSPFLYVSLPLLLFLILSLQSNLQICILIQNMNNFKHSDRKD